MNADSAAEVLEVVFAHPRAMDCINVATALQRVARFAQKGVPLPGLDHLMDLLARTCLEFNSQSIANAWWAVSKLISLGHRTPGHVLDVLEQVTANQCSYCTWGVSSVWYSWGQLARRSRYHPGPRALAVMWAWTCHLGSFLDCQGVSNILMGVGHLRKRFGESFDVPINVLTCLTQTVCDMGPGAFTPQGLVCCAIGCANMGPELHGHVLKLMRVVVFEACRRDPGAFDARAMLNMTTAIQQLGHPLYGDWHTRLLLTTFANVAHNTTGNDDECTQKILSKLRRALYDAGITEHASRAKMILDFLLAFKHQVSTPELASKPEHPGGADNPTPPSSPACQQQPLFLSML
jgi:hypothetical protein